MTMDAFIKKIYINFRSSKPIYRQLVEQIQKLVITEQIEQGDHLPSIRHLGNKLNISPNTVARAYLELEREQIVVTKRGGGTIVSASRDEQLLREIRAKHLQSNVSKDIVRMLGQGYKLDELEAAYLLGINRWKEEFESASTTPSITNIEGDSGETLRITGSHDIALNILITLFKQYSSNIKVEASHVGSLRGLIALEEETADIAGIHLLDEETGEYNIPFIKRILPGRKMVVINLVYRKQGLLFAPGNPKNIGGLGDLAKSDIRFVNRQKGSGTRVLLDLELKRTGIDERDICGFDIEMDNHLAVGLAIAQGRADTGLGIAAAAHSCGLGFLPLFKERYDIVMPAKTFDSKKTDLLMSIISGSEFKKIVSEVEGYDTSKTGSVMEVS
ncbi:MAG: substrate-binding domain-containing protein [Dehalococcoidales bacterium]|nr:substrate-binding domain-containing protein [Dehalococcoidales bacterium]